MVKNKMYIYIHNIYHSIDLASTLPQPPIPLSSSNFPCRRVQSSIKDCRRVIHSTQSRFRHVLLYTAVLLYRPPEGAVLIAVRVVHADRRGHIIQGAREKFINH